MVQLKVINSDMPYAGSTINVVGLFNTATHRPHLAATAFLLRKMLNGVSPNTLRTYAYALALFLTRAESDSEIRHWDNINDELLHAYFEQVLVGERHLAGKSLELNRTVIKEFYNWSFLYGWSSKKRLLSRGTVELIHNRIKIDLARENSIDRFKVFAQYISPEEFRGLLAWTPTQREFEKQRDMICLKLGYLSGWRRSEVVDPSNITTKRIKHAISAAQQKQQLGFYLNIVGKGRGAGKVRTVYLPHELREDIELFLNGAHRKNGQPALLICQRSGERLGVHHTTYLFDRARKSLIAREGNFDRSGPWMSAPYRCFHSLRHSYATNMVMHLREHDLPLTILQELMGHADIETTNAYVHFLATLQSDENTLEPPCLEPPPHRFAVHDQHE